MKIQQLCSYALIVGSLVGLTACANNAPNDQMEAKSLTYSDPYHVQNSTKRTTNTNAVIPSVDRIKTHTTNEHGGTSYGLGSSVYSLIGSSSLHSNGFSSHLESRLSSAGINGVSVFVFDDQIIIASEKQELTGSQYDPLQQKLLSSTAGISAKGREPGHKVGTYGTMNGSDNNLSKAAKHIQEVMGNQVRVVPLNSPAAVQTIKKLRDESGSNATPRQKAANLKKLLELAENKK